MTMNIIVLFTMLHAAVFSFPVTGVVMSNFISPEDSAIEYHGRFDRSTSEMPVFDWPGVYLQTQFEGTSCKILLSGASRYDITIDNAFSGTITVGSAKDTILIAEKLKKGIHSLRVTKRTESNAHSCSFFGFMLDDKCHLKKVMTVNNRRIEFIGDSYTAGYGNEHTSRDCTPDRCDKILFMTTNACKTFGVQLAQSFNAHYQLNAISGKGIVRNYNGNDKGKEFLKFYDQALNSSVNLGVGSSQWDFNGWHPEVIVIGLGINDFLADPPYADSMLFDATYSKFLDFLRQKHPGVKLVCCATDVWPTHALVPRVKKIVDSQKASGKNDVWYFECTTENTALHGHPSVNDHKKVATELQPLVARITGWNYVTIP